MLIDFKTSIKYKHVIDQVAQKDFILKKIGSTLKEFDNFKA